MHVSYLLGYYPFQCWCTYLDQGALAHERTQARVLIGVKHDISQKMTKN